ncbi:MAG: TFIIB-type zinc finger domain-containing protein, partial [Marinosulfonomonas sp.]|nr:TFIIB-type zinc finger domain-containing protein [Marinosulfonomonas sp.]
MENTTEEHRFPCDQCGADLRFSPGESRLICDHCGNGAVIEGDGTHLRAITELDFHSALDAQLPEAEIEETRVVQCPNCAAKFEFDAAVHAAECPFCATPVVTDTGTLRQIKPKGLLPFAMDERASRGALGAWLGGLWFAPNGVKQ